METPALTITLTTKKRTVTLGLSVATIGASLGLNNAKRGEVICGTAGLAALGGAA